MWEQFDSDEVNRREAALTLYSQAGVPDHGNALAVFHFERGREAVARGIWNRFALESEEPSRGRFFFPQGRILSARYSGWYGGFPAHPLTSTEELEEFARSPIDDVRHEVALNPATPSVILVRLADDTDPGTRTDVLAKPLCPSDLLRTRAWLIDEDDDEDPRVLWGAIAGNPSCPESVIHSYIRYAEQEIDEEDSEQADLVEGFENDVLTHLASNVSLPIRDVEFLSQHENSRVRAEIASNPITPLNIVVDLSHDRTALVRKHAALNLLLPGTRLADLASDADPGVRAAVALNPNLRE